MVRKWMALVNMAAAGLIGLFLLGALFFYATRQTDFPLNEAVAPAGGVPKGAFARPPQEYEAIPQSALNLSFSPLSVQLPDLRKFLVYYGKNGRPDAKGEQPALFFAFTGNKGPTAVLPEKKYYILYDKKVSPNQYIFSPDNASTALWIEAVAQGNQAAVKVGMQGEDGALISEPAAYASFSLPEKEFVRFGGTVWEIGKWRVDGTLLARQKARWYGLDKFLEKHGGDEYKEQQSKQRIDFGEGEEVYSAYVGSGDCLIWDDNRWKSVKTGEASLKHPLLCVKKVDERVMNLELWDVDGKGKVSLNLVRASEAWMPQNLEQNFKFVGARTRSQFLFEINGERVLLSPHDWLVFIDGAWKKLVTPKEIDDYVERRTVGPLFVFDRVERKDDKQMILGTLFNAARTETAPVELPLQQSGASGRGPGKQPGKDDKRQKVKETNKRPMVRTGSGRVDIAPPGSPPSQPGPSVNAAPDDDDDDDDE